MDKVKDAVKTTVSAAGIAILAISGYIAITAAKLQEDVVALVTAGAAVLGAAFAALKVAWRNRQGGQGNGDRS